MIDKVGNEIVHYVVNVIADLEMIHETLDLGKARECIERIADIHIIYFVGYRFEIPYRFVFFRFCVINGFVINDHRRDLVHYIASKIAYLELAQEQNYPVLRIEGIDSFAKRHIV